MNSSPKRTATIARRELTTKPREQVGYEPTSVRTVPQEERGPGHDPPKDVMIQQ